MLYGVGTSCTLRPTPKHTWQLHENQHQTHTDIFACVDGKAREIEANRGSVGGGSGGGAYVAPALHPRVMETSRAVATTEKRMVELSV